MRPFLILLMTTLVGCVSNIPSNTGAKHYIGGDEVVSDLGIRVDFDKHRNITTVRAPALNTGPGYTLFHLFTPAMSLSLLKFVGQASLVDDAMLPS